MPVQINEMVIRANIVEPGESKSGGQSQGAAGAGGAVNKEELIRECAELVLEIINNKIQR